MTTTSLQAEAISPPSSVLGTGLLRRRWRLAMTGCAFLVFPIALCSPARLVAQDRAWWDTLPPAATPRIAWTRQSLYVPMPDGVRLAVDRYLPAGASATHRVPTILHLTRYRRGLRFRDPVREAEDGPGFGLMTFLQAGYAVVVVDVRGTGASFGTRRVEFSPEEVHDGWGILDWIEAAPWSDGGVGATGISYPGTTAELIGTIGHPALKAIAPLFSIYDFYDDVTHPGGILLEPFMRTWAAMTAQMDADQFDRLNSTVTGVRPVDGSAGDSLLALAVAEHAGNGSIWELVRQITSRDDTTREGFTLDMVSPHARYDTLSRRIPIYSMGGWADGFAAAPVNRFVEQPSPGSRLTMGPWNHGGGWAYYPGKDPVRSQFDQQGELLRFFDHYLRGKSTGIEREPAVHYFTTGTNEWKSADRWPITTTTLRLFLQADGRLTTVSDSPQERTHAPYLASYSVDTTLGTGNQSRWNTILGGGAVRYPPHRGADGRPDPAGVFDAWTGFETPPLDSAITVTGHVTLRLVAKHYGIAPTVFAYLEEVDSTGAGWLVTEGQLAIVHRAISPAPAWYPAPEAYHSYRRSDMQAITPQDAVTSVIELLPVSHTFRAGSRIRITLAGADADHFALPPTPDGIDVGSWGSFLTLPIEP